MRITIDTQQDSHENIKKAIKMLQTIVGEGPYSNSPDMFSSDSTATDTPSETTSSNPFTNIFGDDISPSKTETISKEDDEADDILNDASEKPKDGGKEDRFADEIMEVY